MPRSLLGLLVVLLIVGIALPMIPMDDRVRRIIIAIVGVFALLVICAWFFGTPGHVVL